VGIRELAEQERRDTFANGVAVEVPAPGPLLNEALHGTEGSNSRLMEPPSGDLGRDEAAERAFRMLDSTYKAFDDNARSVARDLKARTATSQAGWGLRSVVQWASFKMTKNQAAFAAATWKNPDGVLVDLAAESTGGVVLRFDRLRQQTVIGDGRVDKTMSYLGTETRVGAVIAERGGDDIKATSSLRPELAARYTFAEDGRMLMPGGLRGRAAELFAEATHTRLDEEAADETVLLQEQMDDALATAIRAEGDLAERAAAAGLTEREMLDITAFEEEFKQMLAADLAEDIRMMRDMALGSGEDTLGSSLAVFMPGTTPQEKLEAAQAFSLKLTARIRLSLDSQSDLAMQRDVANLIATDLEQQTDNEAAQRTASRLRRTLGAESRSSVAEQDQAEVAREIGRLISMNFGAGFSTCITPGGDQLSFCRIRSAAKVAIDLTGLAKHIYSSVTKAKEWMRSGRPTGDTLELEEEDDIVQSTPDLDTSPEQRKSPKQSKWERELRDLEAGGGGRHSQRDASVRESRTGRRVAKDDRRATDINAKGSDGKLHDVILLSDAELGTTRTRSGAVIERSRRMRAAQREVNRESDLLQDATEGIRRTGGGMGLEQPKPLAMDLTADAPATAEGTTTTPGGTAATGAGMGLEQPKPDITADAPATAEGTTTTPGGTAATGAGDVAPESQTMYDRGKQTVAVSGGVLQGVAKALTDDGEVEARLRGMKAVENSLGYRVANALTAAKSQRGRRMLRNLRAVGTGIVVIGADKVLK